MADIVFPTMTSWMIIHYSHTQSLDLKEACVDAFAKVLQKYGLDAWGVGRAD
jgi:hypothetical protein